MRMEDENNSTSALGALVASRNWSALVAACEESLLRGACRAGAGHAQYAPHLLALICLGHLDAARHLWRQRTALPPQPPSAVDTAATDAAKALWLGDATAARSALAAYAWPAVLAPLAEAASAEIAARGARKVAVAYRRASPTAVAYWCGVPVDEVSTLAGAHAWDCDTDGTIVPANTPTILGETNNNMSVPDTAPMMSGNNGMQRVSELADQLVRLQTTS